VCGKGFNLAEATTLIEICTSLDYSIGSPGYNAGDRPTAERHELARNIPETRKDIAE